MGIVNEILHELEYKETGTFSFVQNLNNVDIEHKVSAFVSSISPSQVYLLASIECGNLSNVIDTSFYVLLAKKFRKQEFYRSEMDKNTTLVLEYKCDKDEEADNDIIVQIEDDPFYFKKYVIRYSPSEYLEAEKYLSDEKDKNQVLFSFVDTIKKYLADTEKFAEYKEKQDSQFIYDYFVKIAVKLPIMPLEIATEKQIKKIPDFMSEELKRKGEINIEGINSLLDKFDNNESLDVETILSLWNNSVNK